jgi:hypothetical protein
MDWKEIGSVPSDRDVEVAVVDGVGIHPLRFPCRYRDAVWINAVTRKQIEINPTHWREWMTETEPSVRPSYPR